MISRETAEAWEEVEKEYRSSTKMWAMLMVFDFVIATISMYREIMLTATVASFFAGFAFAALWATRRLHAQWQTQRMVIVSYDATLDQMTEALALAREQGIAPPIEPVRSKETRH